MCSTNNCKRESRWLENIVIHEASFKKFFPCLSFHRFLELLLMLLVNFVWGSHSRMVCAKFSYWVLIISLKWAAFSVRFSFLCRDLSFLPKLSYHRNLSLPVYSPILFFSFCQKTNLHLYKQSRLSSYLVKPLFCHSPQCYHCFLFKYFLMREIPCILIRTQFLSCVINYYHLQPKPTTGKICYSDPHYSDSFSPKSQKNFWKNLKRQEKCVWNEKWNFFFRIFF